MRIEAGRGSNLRLAEKYWKVVALRRKTLWLHDVVESANCAPNESLELKAERGRLFRLTTWNLGAIR